MLENVFVVYVDIPIQQCLVENNCHMNAIFNCANFGCCNGIIISILVNPED